MVHLDSTGNPTTAANPEALAHLELAIDDLLHFRGDLMGDLGRSLEADPQLALAQAYNVYLGVLSTEAGGAQAVQLPFEQFMAGVRISQFNDRERRHLQAAQAMLAGDWHSSSQQLAEISYLYPRDTLAVAIGHQLDFFTGNSAMLRDRVAGVMSAWTPQDRHYANLLGMLAFGLEETGQYDLSEELGLEAVERNPKNVWAVHAVAHTYEMQARFALGMQYMDQRLPDWATGNFYTVHNWWHYALYAIEAGHEERALEIHDAALFTPDQAGISLQLLDASALCWRLLLNGRIERARFQAQAERWKSKMEPAFSAFNDAHMIMAFVGAGWEREAEQVIASRQAWIEAHPSSRQTNLAMTRDIGLPVCRALVAFGRGEYPKTIEFLLPIRRRLHEYGGSHAQRDAVLQTLVEAALRSGQHQLAQYLLSERISVKPRSPLNWLKQAQLLEQMGQQAQAALARKKVQDLRG